MCAARSSRSRAASSRRSVRSGSTTSARWRAVRASSVALSRRASSSSTCSPRARRAGLEGSVSTASQMIAACAADASPAVQRREGLGQLGDELLGVHHGPSSLAPGQAGKVGEPVGSRAPVQALAGQVANVGLGEEPRLERRHGTLQRLDGGQALRPGPRRRTRSRAERRAPPPGRGRPPAQLRETHTRPRQAPHDRHRAPGDPPAGTWDDLDASAPQNDELREHRPGGLLHLCDPRAACCIHSNIHSNGCQASTD